IEAYERALELSKKHHRISEIDILGAMGNAALDQGDYPKALQYQYDSLALLDTIDDSLRRSVVLSNIGSIYLEVEDLDKADVFFKRSFLLKKDIRDSSGLASVAYNRGTVSYKRGDLDEADMLYKEALEVASAVGRKETEAYIEDSLGSIGLARGEVKVALSHFSRAIEISSSFNIRAILCASLIGKGRVLVALKKPIESIKLLKESLLLCEESGLLPLQCDCVSALATAYEAAGKLKESVQYFNKFIALNAEVHSEQKQRALVEISARVEIEKADRERERMEKIAKDADERAELLHSETERQSNELTTLALQLVQKNEFLCELKEEIEPAIKSPRKAKEISERIDDHIKSDRDWETFEHQFNQIHRDFLAKLMASYPTLTPAESKVAVLTRLGLSTKAIASLLCLSKRTVENHRQSIRHKLALRVDDNLVSFLTGLESK
ncbi:MAG TPA: tetratricopeptide repeat protein, partial [Candidatus Kapabacteria bacterium]|nr:tetratricopeptide repeat protein [Candidatus Kapabacteria bacterium]